MKELIQLLDKNEIKYYFKGKHLDLYINDNRLKDYRVIHHLDIEYVVNKLNL